MEVDRYENVTSLGECHFSGRVVDISEGESSVKVLLDDLRVEGKRQNCKLVAYLPATFQGKLTLSDTVFLYGNIEKREG
jgi:hypothetical protein